MSDKTYNEQVNRIATATYLSTLEHGLARDRMQALHDDIMALQQTVELTAGIYGKSVQQVEEDVIDAIEYLPVEDLSTAHRLKQEGLLN